VVSLCRTLVNLLTQRRFGESADKPFPEAYATRYPDWTLGPPICKQSSQNNPPNHPDHIILFDATQWLIRSASPTCGACFEPIPPATRRPGQHGVSAPPDLHTRGSVEISPCRKKCERAAPHRGASNHHEPTSTFDRTHCSIPNTTNSQPINSGETA